MSDVSGVWSMVAGMANGSNDMLSAVKKRLSSKLGSRASVLKLESLSDDVNVGEEKPEVGVGPPAPLLRRLRWSSALLSRKPFGSPEAGKPMVSEAESSGCGSDERLQFIIDVCLKGDTGCAMSGSSGNG